VNTVDVFLVCKLAVGLLQKQRADGSKVRRVWNTRTNHGQASERRVCVLSHSEIDRAISTSSGETRVTCQGRERRAPSPFGVTRSFQSRGLALLSWCRVPNCPSQESICEPVAAGHSRPGLRMSDASGSRRSFSSSFALPSSGTGPCT